MSVTVRRAATPDEVDAAGELTAQAYQADRLIDPEDAYLEELSDARRRADEAILLVAVVPGVVAAPAEPLRTDAGEVAAGGVPDVVVGTITMAPAGTSYAETAEPGELELRMLAVAPEMRGRGIAETLMRATLREAALRGYRRLVLSTLDSMTAAQRLYGRLGWTRVPERDWGHVEIHLRVFTWEAPPGPSPRVEQETWPPMRVEELDGFTLGMSDGITRRANSALVDAAVLERDAVELDACLSRVEAAYRLAGLAPCVRVDDLALGEVLAARGYHEVTPTLVLVRDLADVTPVGDVASLDVDEADGQEATSTRVRATSEPAEEWLDLWLGGDAARASHREAARTIAVGARSRYLSAVEDGAVRGIVRVAVARADDDGVVWAGISGLAVVPEARRRGLGRELVRAAFEEARGLGADRAFVQIMARNVASIELFERLGFQVASAYRYAERMDD